MHEDKILELKKEILSGNAGSLFLDTLVEVLNKNVVLYTDNCAHLESHELEAVTWVEPFLHLLYRGSKHSVGQYCENGFIRLIKHNDIYMLFKYFCGPDTFIIVELVKEIEQVKIKRVVTLDLLQERLQEAENVKNELSPILSKYLKAGLTFEEITRMFVEIMRENRIKM